MVGGSAARRFVRIREGTYQRRRAPGYNQTNLIRDLGPPPSTCLFDPRRAAAPTHQNRRFYAN